MATSSYWAGNRYAENSIHPPTQQQSSFVRSSGAVATRRNPVQQPRASDRVRSTQIPPPFPPSDYTTDEQEAPKQRRSFWLWVVVVLLVGILLYGMKLQVVDPWWTGVQNQIHYGDSKMGYSVLQLTGDTTSSNIITFVRADTKTGSAYLIVLDVQPGKAPQQFIKAVMGSGATNQTITSATTEDANGDGKTDVLIHIQESPVTFTLLNDGSGNLRWAIP